jgi:hypothetical protein
MAIGYLTTFTVLIASPREKLAISCQNQIMVGSTSELLHLRAQRLKVLD